MIDHDAAVLDHFDPGFTQTIRGWAVMDSELHPNSLGTGIERQNFVYMRWDMF
jgi:hypothetical protein